jgi:4'-phosphopantetheinyl transferase
MSSTPSSGKTRVDLWLARDAQIRDPALLAEYARILSPEETRRVERMQFEAGRHQQLVTRAMVRNVLSHYHPDTAPRDWLFELGEHGRPAVAAAMAPDARASNFNLAHTDGLVVMALGRVDRLGVDVERLDQRVNLAVARRYFSAAEITSLDSLPPEERVRRFQRLWTLKEAYLKALGTGIVGGLGSMTFHFDGEDLPRLECADDPQAARWVFKEFVEQEHRIALAILAPPDESGSRVEIFDYPRDLR